MEAATQERPTLSVVSTVPPQKKLLERLGERYGVEPLKVMDALKGTCMPLDITDAEFIAALIVADRYGLDPFTKQIHFFRDQHNRIQNVVGVDGWDYLVNIQPTLKGFEFREVWADGKIGKELLGMTCLMHRHDREITPNVTEWMLECNRDKGAWKTHKMRMLRHRAFCQAARIVFGFAGLISHDEFEAWMEKAQHGGMLINASRPRQNLARADAVDIQAIPDPDALSEAEASQVNPAAEVEPVKIVDPEPTEASPDLPPDVADEITTEQANEPVRFASAREMALYIGMLSDAYAGADTVADVEETATANAHFIAGLDPAHTKAANKLRDDASARVSANARA